MFKNILIIAFFFLVALLGDKNNLAAYDSLIAFLNGQEMLIAGGVTLFSVCLVFVSFLFSSTPLYPVFLVLSRFSFWASQFLACLVSFLAVSCFVSFGVSLWLDVSRMLTPMPFVFLGAACLSIKFFDFNQPVRKNFLGSILLMAVSAGVIFGGEILGY